MLYYSEKLKKTYKTVEELETAEKELEAKEEAKKQLLAEKNSRRQEVQDAYRKRRNLKPNIEKTTIVVILMPFHIYLNVYAANNRIEPHT